MDCVYLPAETKVVYLWLARTCQSVSKDSRLHYRSSRGRGTAIRGVSISLVTFERSEEHTSELQSLMRISYAVFCLKKKTKNRNEKQRIAHQQTGRGRE